MPNRALHPGRAARVPRPLRAARAHSFGGAAGAALLLGTVVACGTGATSPAPGGSGGPDGGTPSASGSEASASVGPTPGGSDAVGEWFELVPADDPWSVVRPYGDPDGPGAPDGWAVDGDELHALPGGGPDLATRDVFGDFELEVTWRVAPGGNGGVMYRVVEGEDPAWWTGPEYQVLDDEGHPDGADLRTSAGSVYALIGPEASLARPAGEPNETRIVVRDGIVEHWLNGTLAVTYEWRSPAVLDAIAASKFAGSAGFMAADEGRIVLQHHGEEAWYSGARVRALGP